MSLSVDTILASRLAQEVGDLAGVPVYPTVPYGLAQQWTAFPGTVTLRVHTYLAVIRDVLDSIRRAGDSAECCWSTATEATLQQLVCSKNG